MWNVRTTRSKRPTQGFRKRSLVLILALNAISYVCHGQLGSDSHLVTVLVQEITVMQTSVGNINMQITALDIVAGQDVMTTTDQSSNLLWGTNGSNRKITLGTNLTGSLFTLKAQAIDPSQGTAAPEVTLSSTPSDFMLNIGRTSGFCTIKYTGTASAEQGVGSDSHLITFTIQSQ